MTLNFIGETWNLVDLDFIYFLCSICFLDLYMCGGYDGAQIWGDLWKIDLKSLQWCRLPATMPKPSYFHSATVCHVSA